VTTYIQRQLGAFLARGDVDAMSEAQQFAFRLRDARPSTILKVDDGKWTSQALTLNASDSYVVQLPSDYASANRLHGVFTVSQGGGKVKAVVVSPELTGTSTQLIYSETGRGLWVFQQRITSITLSLAAAQDDAVIEYFLFELPDLADADSYRDGNRTLGYVS
jgi:hypothetical protein